MAHPTSPAGDHPRVGGVLLTGGASRRMGVDKATLDLGGGTLAARAGAVLAAVADPVVEVGPGVSGLPSFREQPAGSGPLVSLVAGAVWLAADAVRLAADVSATAAGPTRPFGGPVLVLAVDLPGVGVAALRMLTAGPVDASVVPRVGGRPQYLCARWSAVAIETATRLVAQGVRAMHALAAAVPVIYLDEEDWPSGVDATTFADVDTPADVAAFLADGGPSDGTESHPG